MNHPEGVRNALSACINERLEDIENQSANNTEELGKEIVRLIEKLDCMFGIIPNERSKEVGVDLVCWADRVQSTLEDTKSLIAELQKQLDRL